MLDLANQRLYNQHLTGKPFDRIEEVVRWLGAVQSQDYGGAKWALGLRLQGIADADIDRAFNEGKILRTHVMRPTWHFVDPADIRWLLNLTAPRVHAFNAYYYRQLEIDEALIQRSNEAIIKALQGNNYLMRSELASVLQNVGIEAEGMRLGYIIHHAELDAIICSGPRRGKQFTYSLLDERAPQAKRLTRDEALVELIRRYFTSHGPATMQDFAWWSGLTVTDTKTGIELLKPQLDSEVIDGQTYWFSASMSTPPTQDPSPYVHLLPNYDEYTVAYKDRSAIYDPAQYQDSEVNFLFNHTLVINNQVVGSWKRTVKQRAVVIEFAPFLPFSEAENQALTVATERFGKFMELPIVLA